MKTQLHTAVLRAFTGIALAIVAGFAAMPATAQSNYPNKPVRILAGAPPGGGNDIMARLIAQRLSENLGQQVIVENRPGAGATLATDLVAKSAPDGYTLFLTPSAHALSPSIYRKLPFDPVKDFAAVGQMASVPLVVIVSASLQVNTLRELIDLARAKPSFINFGSGGNGAAQHLAGEFLKSLAGIEMVHVPYKGSGQAIPDLIAGQIQLMVEPLASAMPHIRGGRVKALAITSRQRVPSLPELPTAEEAGLPGFEVTAWYGLLAPAGTPPEVVARLNAEVNRIIAQPAMRESLATQGAIPVGGTPQQFMDLIVAEIARWRPIIQKAGIRAD
jgi:tripartite-type tricarboxylate transporter receptor subunit TctC